MKKIVLTILLTSLLVQSCVDVKENVYDKYKAAEFYGTPAGANASLASLYALIPGNFGTATSGATGYAGADKGWYDVNCMSTDEQVVPHRNDGNWEKDFTYLYLHTWTASTPGYISATWEWLFKSVTLANQTIALLEDGGADPVKIAEARVFRAFMYYLLIDDFGDVPFYTDPAIKSSEIKQQSRKATFDFIVSELTSNVEKLSAVKGGDQYGKFNKWAGYALLAKVYLNAEVYTGTAMWSECLEVCNKIDAGGFSLHPANPSTSVVPNNTYYELFGDVCPDDETIFAIETTEGTRGRNVFTIRSLAGPHGLALFKLATWNGTVTHKDYVNKFDTADVRRDQFIIGAVPGDVTYTEDLPNIDNPGADPYAGYRSFKFYPAGRTVSQGASNDFPIYRYADILLMKAECHARLGDFGSAKPFVDQVRARVGLDPLPALTTLDPIYDERGFELSWEGHRRQDMIRFGKYLLPHDLKPQTEDFRVLFPIPTSAINTNPSLKQNPGY